MGELVVVAEGQRLKLQGRRAEAVVVLIVALLKRPHLEDAEHWSAQINVTPGQIIPHCSDTDAPTKRRHDDLKEVS